ncbi:MAG: hypothetical protein FJ308_21355 [Planctomycetes bacterium]|nr:hypothetical protein [Planctomycetota bacterium]
MLLIITATLFVCERSVSRAGDSEKGSTSSPIVNAVQPVSILDLAKQSTSDMNLMPPMQIVPNREYDETQIAALAASNASTANLIRSERLLQKYDSERKRWAVTLVRQPESGIQECIAIALEYRERERAASTAVQLHYGIAASSMGIASQDDLLRYLEIQQRAQDALIEQGIGIGDPMQLHRLRLQVEGQRLATSSTTGQLRTQLSLLVGKQVACEYMPLFDSNLVPSDSDVCDYVAEAMRCRVDLCLLHSLRCKIVAGDLDELDLYAAEWLGVPQKVESKARLQSWMKSKVCGRDSELKCRQSWLDALIGARTQQITVEVEIAFEKKKAAALRWVNARALVDAWKQRILQLERLSEARGNLAEQISARIELARAEGEVVKRWVEWHEANAELIFAVGRSQ